MAEHPTNPPDPLAPPPDATVVLRDLHVHYHVGGRSRPRLKDLFTRNESVELDPSKVIHAVRGVDLVARRGEAIGLVGRNGSGKSTTLAALAGLLPPTSGEVLATSQPVLLGVGAALDSNLTGRRNIELGCLALGMDRDEIVDRIESIAEFSGLGRFVDLPLKTYSSGMRARLLFSVATSIEPEILLIDEALAVGDEAFRRKSEGRIEELLASAGTVFIVSHSLPTIVEECTRVAWIDEGKVRLDGDPEDVVAEYKRAI